MLTIDSLARAIRYSGCFDKFKFEEYRVVISSEQENMGPVSKFMEAAKKVINASQITSGLLRRRPSSPISYMLKDA